MKCVPELFALSKEEVEGMGDWWCPECLNRMACGDEEEEDDVQCLDEEEEKELVAVDEEDEEEPEVEIEIDDEPNEVEEVECMKETHELIAEEEEIAQLAPPRKRQRGRENKRDRTRKEQKRVRTKRERVQTEEPEEYEISEGD